MNMAWERPPEYDDPPDPPEEDCLNCGMCEACIQRSIATAEEMNNVTAEETSVVKMFMALEEWANGQRRTWSVFRRRPVTSDEAFGPHFGCELRWTTGTGSIWRVEKSAHTPMLAVVMALEAAIAAESS